MCVTCDRGYSLDSTGCPFNLRGEHTAGRAGEDSWEVRACFLCRAGSRVNAVCCPSLSFFPFPLSYLISVIIRISCVWKWFSEQMCLRLGNWLSNCAMYVRWQMWARFCANGQLIQTSPDICPICQLLCSMENGLVGFFLYCWGFLFWTETLSSLRDPWAYRQFSDPHLLSSICCWIFDQFHGHLFGQLCGVNGSRKMYVIQGGIAAPLTSIKSKWDSF